MVNKTSLSIGDVICEPMSPKIYLNKAANFSGSVVEVLRGTFLFRMFVRESFCYRILLEPDKVPVAYICVIPKKEYDIVDIVVEDSACSVACLVYALQVILDYVNRETDVCRFYSYSTLHTKTREALESHGFKRCYDYKDHSVVTLEI